MQMILIYSRKLPELLAEYFMRLNLFYNLVNKLARERENMAALNTCKRQVTGQQ